MRAVRAGAHGAGAHATPGRPGTTSLMLQMSVGCLLSCGQWGIRAKFKTLMDQFKAHVATAAAHFVVGDNAIEIYCESIFFFGSDQDELA